MSLPPFLYVFVTMCPACTKPVEVRPATVYQVQVAWASLGQYPRSMIPEQDAHRLERALTQGMVHPKTLERRPLDEN